MPKKNKRSPARGQDQSKSITPKARPAATSKPVQRIADAKLISLRKLCEHVSQDLGKLAWSCIREKWRTGELLVIRRYRPSIYGESLDLEESAAPPELLLQLEARGIRGHALVDGGFNCEGKATWFFVIKVDAAKFWPWPESAQKLAPGYRDSRGGKSEVRWEDALAVAAAYVFDHGIPKTQKELADHVESWFGEGAPANSVLNEHIGRFYRYLKLRRFD